VLGCVSRGWFGTGYCNGMGIEVGGHESVVLRELNRGAIVILQRSLSHHSA
jgi:hypothetical protein